MEPEILDDFKKKEPLKNSRISLVLLGVAAASIAIVVIALMVFGIDDGVFDFVGWFCLGVCVLANIGGLIYGGLSLYKNEEDVLFQVIAIAGHLFLSCIFFGLLIAFLGEPGL